MNLIFKPSYLNSNFRLTRGYFNLDLNNPALDSRFHGAVYSLFQVLGSNISQRNLDSGFQWLVGLIIPESLSYIPDSEAQDSRFQQQNFSGFRKPHSVKWGETFIMTNNYASDFLQLKPIPCSTARFSKDFVLKSIKQLLPFTISCDGLKKLMLPFHPIRKKSYSEIESNANLINDSHVTA